MNIAIIPARGGSKRIPYKNIKDFSGKPAISYAIEAAKKTGLFDKIIVSTDDPLIAKVAKSFGAETPFVREAHLSDDNTHIGPVVKQCCQWLIEEQGIHPDFICMIFATAPLISDLDITAAYELIVDDSKVGNVSSVAKFPSPIQRALTVSKEGSIEMLMPENFSKRSQELEDTYYYAGQFYWSRLEFLLNEKESDDLLSLPFIIDRSRAQDIDTLEDWEYAENLYKIINH
jgi:pseudaminic acid cytidylyltransferase